MKDAYTCTHKYTRTRAYAIKNKLLIQLYDKKKSFYQNINTKAIVAIVLTFYKKKICQQIFSTYHRHHHDNEQATCLKQNFWIFFLKNFGNFQIKKKKIWQNFVPKKKKNDADDDWQLISVRMTREKKTNENKQKKIV